MPVKAPRFLENWSEVANRLSKSKPVGSGKLMQQRSNSLDCQGPRVVEGRSPYMGSNKQLASEFQLGFGHALSKRFETGGGMKASRTVLMLYRRPQTTAQVKH